MVSTRLVYPNDVSESVVTQSVSLNVSQRFRTVFQEASRSTGAQFDFLVHTAKRESGMNATAKAPTSSATGLFQFVEQTWLGTMKESGPALGYGNAAQHIVKSGDKYIVRDPKVRQQILDMRNDPKASAMLAGALARQNEASLTQRLNRTPSSGELYAAHFLGAQGSGRLIELAESKPDLAAYKIFPQQAKANRNIFFDKGGHAKTVSEVYDNLVGTVPEKKHPLSRIFNLGNWFKPKASMEASRFAQTKDVEPAVKTPPQPTAQKVMIDLAGDLESSPDAFFTQPDRAASQAMPSRYGMSYAASSTEPVKAPTSRFAMDPTTQAASAINDRVSRVFSAHASEVTARKVEAQQPQAEAMPLPRRKPISADTYLDALGGALPKAKPVRDEADSVNGTASRPLDLTARLADAQPQPRRRFGALDLTAFLKSETLPPVRKS